jgi:hypothetical protein
MVHARGTDTGRKHSRRSPGHGRDRRKVQTPPAPWRLSHTVDTAGPCRGSGETVVRNCIAVISRCKRAGKHTEPRVAGEEDPLLQTQQGVERCGQQLGCRSGVGFGSCASQDGSWRSVNRGRHLLPCLAILVDKCHLGGSVAVTVRSPRSGLRSHPSAASKAVSVRHPPKNP